MICVSVCGGCVVGVWVDVLMCVLVVCVGVYTYVHVCVTCGMCVCCMVCVDGGMKGVEQVSFVKHFQS